MPPLPRDLVRRLAPQGLRQALMPLRLKLMERTLARAVATPEPDLQAGDLVVSGLFNMSKGVSRAAHLTAQGIAAAGWPLTAHDIEPVLKAGPGSRKTLPFVRAGGAWIAHINAPEALLALTSLSPDAWRGRTRIGYWAYELPAAPAAWGRVARAFHEIWAPSVFAAEAMRAAGARSVRVVPHPAHLGERPTREAMSRWADLKGGRLLILAMGEVGSSLARKNLEGAVEIFVRAFPAAKEDGPRLLLKVHSAGSPEALAASTDRLRRGRDDILCLTERLSHGDTAGLIASCDVLLSPHRSEGFGLTLAEALLEGVPALATGWSGNLDFMSGLDPLLIAHRLVPVRDASGVYSASGQVWAEPDVGDAVQKLLDLIGNPVLRRRLAEEGRARVLALGACWSPDRLQALLGRSVDRVWAAP
jgi:glycosyltransferase involved in cell wall biosynthesis